MPPRRHCQRLVHSFPSSIVDVFVIGGFLNSIPVQYLHTILHCLRVPHSPSAYTNTKFLLSLQPLKRTQHGLLSFQQFDYWYNQRERCTFCNVSAQQYSSFDKLFYFRDSGSRLYSISPTYHLLIHPSTPFEVA